MIMRDDMRYYAYSALSAIAVTIAFAGIYCGNILFVVAAGMLLTLCVLDALRRPLP